MPSYTPLGIEKIVTQARANIHLIRCPRDTVVMRVLGGQAERRDGSGTAERFSDRVPSSRYWRVCEVDLECPACLRRAPGITVRPPPASRETRAGAAAASRVTESSGDRILA